MRRTPCRSSCLLVTLGISCAMPAFAAERVLIDGSTGVAPLVIALAKAYQAQNPGVLLEIGKGMGTKARIEALRDARIDIAMASHGLDQADLERQGMVVHEIGKVAVVFGVHKGVAIASLSEDQVCAIYGGKLQNWKEVAGSDISIAPFTRPDSEVDTEVARARISCFATLSMPATVKVMPKAPEMARALAATPGSIGMTTMTVIEQSGGMVKPLALNGVAPDVANVESKRYSLTRDSFLVTRGRPSAATAGFIDFVRSAAGAQVISDNGAVPVK